MKQMFLTKLYQCHDVTVTVCLILVQNVNKIHFFHFSFHNIDLFHSVERKDKIFRFITG